MKTLILTAFFFSHLATAALYYCDCLCSSQVIEVPQPKCTQSIYRFKGELHTPIAELREFNPMKEYGAKADWMQLCRRGISHQPACQNSRCRQRVIILFSSHWLHWVAKLS